MATDTASSLALEAYFDEGDVRFLAEVLRAAHAKALGALASRWFRDPRAELRRMLLEYIDDGCERPNHQPLVKRLYKIAEGAKDDEVLAHFLVAFDRLARRKLEKKTRWDWVERESVTTEVVRPDPAIPGGRAPTARMSPVGGRAPEPQLSKHRDPMTGREVRKNLQHLSSFTYRTRRYLQRRAWRYFRVLGKTNPRGYRDAIVIALQLYRDDHLKDAIQLLDAWGLLHALYHHSTVLEQDRVGWTVTEGASLAALQPAPIYPEVWKESPAPLFDLLVRAQARAVRLFAISTLRRVHGPALERTEFALLRRVLLSPHDEVQVFAAELLRTARGVELLPVEEWLKLLRVANAIALPVLCELFQKNVHPDRLQTDACLELACAAAAPVARLGFTWLRARPVNSQMDVARILKLAGAEADVVRGEAIDWVIAVIRESPFLRPMDARELVDARHADVRGKAIAWIFTDARLRDEVMLWGAMCETPYDDVRAALLLHLERVRSEHAASRRLSRAGALDAAAMRGVWASVLLAVHRGNRAKAFASRQVAERVAAHPDEADRLLPLLGISLRSLRAPEKRNALTAIGRAAYFAMELRAAVARHLPGLTLFPERISVPALPPPARGEETSGGGSPR